MSNKDRENMRKSMKFMENRLISQIGKAEYFNAVKAEAKRLGSVAAGRGALISACGFLPQNKLIALGGAK